MVAVRWVNAAPSAASAASHSGSPAPSSDCLAWARASARSARRCSWAARPSTSMPRRFRLMGVRLVRARR